MLSTLEKDLDAFHVIRECERCPSTVVGTAIDDGHSKVCDDLFSNDPVNLPLNVLLGKSPKTTHTDKTVTPSEKSLNAGDIDTTEATYRVLHLLTVAAKNFPITIGDRNVGDVTHRNQMVGKYQTPVADCAVTMMGSNIYCGEAMSMGEKPTVVPFDTPASGRMCVNEAITNIVAVSIGDIDNIKLSANRMMARGNGGEDEKLYRIVEAVSRACQALDLGIPISKDGLSMKAAWQDGEERKSVASPLNLIISVSAPVEDVRKTVTPVLKDNVNSFAIPLVIDLGNNKCHMGDSVLAQVYSRSGNEAPDIDVGRLKTFYQLIQQLVQEDRLLAYHGRSDGGLFVTLAEMAFVSRRGVNLDLLTVVNKGINI